jgi:hypothetical protein
VVVRRVRRPSLEHFHDGSGDAGVRCRGGPTAAVRTLKCDSVADTSHEYAAAEELPGHHGKVEHVRLVGEHATRTIFVGPERDNRDEWRLKNQIGRVASSSSSSL